MDGPTQTVKGDISLTPAYNMSSLELDLCMYCGSVPLPPPTYIRLLRFLAWLRRRSIAHTYTPPATLAWATVILSLEKVDDANNTACWCGRAAAPPMCMLTQPARCTSARAVDRLHQRAAFTELIRRRISLLSSSPDVQTFHHRPVCCMTSSIHRLRIFPPSGSSAGESATDIIIQQVIHRPAARALRKHTHLSLP